MQDSRGSSPASGGGGKRCARVGSDTLDHGAQAVGTLRRQMLAKSEFVEHRQRIGRQNLLRRTAGIQRQQDRDRKKRQTGGSSLIRQPQGLSTDDAINALKTD